MNEDFNTKGIATDTKGGVKYVPAITIKLTVHNKKSKWDKFHETFGTIVLWTITALCFVAIGALIGALTLIL